MTDNFFNKDGGFDIERIYEEVFSMKAEQMERLKADVIDKYDCAMGIFEDAPEENKEFLKLFSFICALSFDVYMKKMIIERMIDGMREPQEKEHRQKHNAKQSDRKKGEEK